MKKTFLNILLVGSLAALSSCEKGLETYSATPAIYFNDAARLPAYVGEPIKDSTLLSFSLLKEQETIVNMVIAATGAISNVDRPYRLEVNPNSTAIAGQHYELLSSNFSIKKNKTTDTVKIKFFRTPDMQNNQFLLSFDLKANENFNTAMSHKTQNNGTVHSYINYRWWVDDLAKKPKRWLDAYLGTFSQKKLKLMIDILGADPAYMNTSISIGELVAYGKYMQRYLNEQEAAGNIIYEADNVTKMVMGAYVQ